MKGSVPAKHRRIPVRNSLYSANLVGEISKPGPGGGPRLQLEVTLAAKHQAILHLARGIYRQKERTIRHCGPRLGDSVHLTSVRRGDCRPGFVGSAEEPVPESLAAQNTPLVVESGVMGGPVHVIALKAPPTTGTVLARCRWHCCLLSLYLSMKTRVWG